MKAGRPANDWLSLREASRRLGIDKSSLGRVVATGSIRVRQIPGLDPRYSAEDCDSIVARSVTRGPRLGPRPGRSA